MLKYPYKDTYEEYIGKNKGVNIMKKTNKMIIITSIVLIIIIAVGGFFFIRKNLRKKCFCI